VTAWTGSLSTPTIQTAGKPMDVTLFSEARILVVDDQLANVKLLKRLLKLWGYENVVTTTDGAAVLELCREPNADLVLLDLNMPDPDGLRVLELLGDVLSGPTPLPVLVLTADLVPEVRFQALSMGARDFVSKPFDPTEVRLRVSNLLEMRRLQLDAQRQNELLVLRVAERTRDLDVARSELLDRLALAAEYRDDETQEHARRIGRTSGLLAERLGLSRETCELMVRAAPLHDVGKIGIPDSILLKPTRLTADEFAVMKCHARIGAELLEGGRSPVLRLASEIALSHHERWNGAGYPSGLAGKAIPLSGRIVAVADVFDALSHARPYKGAWPLNQALYEVCDREGPQFDPAVVKAFRNLDHERLLTPIVKTGRFRARVPAARRSPAGAPAR
jgi:putative two-component system response regulator